MSSFPQPFRSTVSHWQATNRGLDTLYDHGRDEPLPENVIDYVIIGGGMTGASLAYALSREGVAPNAKIVLLEAKDLASGASGRNGGQVAPFSFLNWAQLIKPYEEGGSNLSLQEGLDVLQLERDNLAYVAQTVKEHDWHVDFWKGEKIEVAVSDKQREKMGKAYTAWKDALGSSTKCSSSTPDWEFIDDPTEAEKISRIKDTKAISRGPAGSIHPHKLATHFMKAALSSNQVDFFSWAPVSRFEQDVKSKEWIVDVGTRGNIRAKRLIVCTNAHTRHLFPGDPIDKHLTPYQAQAANVTPPPSYSGRNALQHTIVAERGPYLIQTPHSGIVLGLGEETGFELGITKKHEIFEVTDDSYVKPAIKTWLDEYCKKNFNGWGEEAPGEGGMRVWSGIICASRDLLPLVGQVPEKEGLYVAVGFHGHGMARIPQVSRCLAQIITKGGWDDRLPRSFEITKERLEKAQAAPPFITQQEKGRTWTSFAAEQAEKLNPMSLWSRR